VAAVAPIAPGAGAAAKTTPYLLNQQGPVHRELLDQLETRSRDQGVPNGRAENGYEKVRSLPGQARRRPDASSRLKAGGVLGRVMDKPGALSRPAAAAEANGAWRRRGPAERNGAAEPAQRPWAQSLSRRPSSGPGA